MRTEPIVPLARAVSATVGRLDLHDVTVHIEHGTVIADGSGLMVWGQRARLETALKSARLHFETTAPNFRIVVYPSEIR